MNYAVIIWKTETKDGDRWSLMSIWKFHSALE